MSTESKESSRLGQLRSLVPNRALTQFEAYRIAELQANRLLELAAVDQPGTPDELITAQSFLRVSVRSDLPVSGLTKWYKPQWRVILNGSEPAVRRRFSLHHEFKHILDHGLVDVVYPSTGWMSGEERAEKVCDYFAACILMPKRLVKRRFFEGLTDVAELAAEFGVSPRAMRFRLEQLKLVGTRPRCDYDLDLSGDLSGYYFRRSQALEIAA